MQALVTLRRTRAPWSQTHPRAMADSPDAQILQKLLQPSPAAVASHLARQAAKAEVQRVQRAPGTDTDLYGWGLTHESAQELMHDLFDVVEEFPDMVAQLCHDLKKLGYFSGFPLPAELKDKFSGMEVISEREIKETAMAFLRRGTATDSTDASSHEIRQVVQDESSSSSKRRSSSKQRGTAAQSNGSRNSDTTLVMMNLPVDYSHEKSRGLVDTLGFRDKYDAVIWFPRKQIGQQNLSHAVVNFKTPEDCVAFRRRIRKGGINPSGESRLARRGCIVSGCSSQQRIWVWVAGFKVVSSVLFPGPCRKDKKLQKTHLWCLQRLLGRAGISLIPYNRMLQTGGVLLSV